MAILQKILDVCDMDSSKFIPICAALFFAGLGYLVYRSTIPKPLPEIPFLASSIKPFGDIPDMLAHEAKTKQALLVILEKAREIHSPIFQAFLEPFGRPWVVITDPLVTEDILVRRTKEFDTSPIFMNLFAAPAGDSMIVKKTSDPGWRANRRLMADTMSVSFLHGTVAGNITTAVSALVELWSNKCRLVENHIFDASSDIADMTMEAIYSSAFGEAIGVTDGDIKTLSQLESLAIPVDKDIPVSFPKAARPDAFNHMYALADSTEIPLKSPFGVWHHRFALRFQPRLRQAMKWKKLYISKRLDDAWERFSSDRPTSDEDIKCASDLLVAREVSLAAKEGRKVQYDTGVTRDELYGFIQGGHDTTATTVQWAVKFLMEFQDVQVKLRESLKTVFDTQNPNGLDIAKADLPYLDACIEESLRLGGTAAWSFRRSVVDSDILGYRIPSGTDVVMSILGPGYRSPKIPSKVELKDSWKGAWDPHQLDKFLPDRWLTTGDDGKLKCDIRAGPRHSFGTGIRACFGKRLALLSLRIILTTLVLNFEFEKIEGELGTLEAMDVLTHRPQVVFTRLIKI